MNKQQGRAYVDFDSLDLSKPLSPKVFQEYISEGFDAFFTNPDALKKKDPDLYNYLEMKIYEKSDKPDK